MNAFIDKGDLQGPPSLWGEPFKRLIDHPKILPYLLDLLGPHVRLDHDYAIFMEEGPQINGLHGGEDGGGPGGPEADHWYKYRDGIMRNGLSVMTYNLADAPEGAGGFSCIPGSHKSNFLREIPTEVRRFERPAHYVAQPSIKAGDVVFFTEALVHGTMPWKQNINGGRYSINTAPTLFMVGELLRHQQIRRVNRTTETDVVATLYRQSSTRCRCGLNEDGSFYKPC